MYQKQILMEKLKEATASVLPISLIVMAISFVLVPVDAGLMLSFVIATAMLILGMGLFTLGADMSMSRIGNYMGSKLTKSRKLPLILTVSFALGVAITVAEPDLQVLAGNVPEIDTTVLILTVSVGVGFFLMLCMVRILFSISLRTIRYNESYTNSGTRLFFRCVARRTLSLTKLCMKKSSKVGGTTSI